MQAAALEWAVSSKPFGRVHSFGTVGSGRKKLMLVLITILLTKCIQVPADFNVRIPTGRRRCANVCLSVGHGGVGDTRFWYRHALSRSRYGDDCAPYTSRQDSRGLRIRTASASLEK